MKKVNYNAVIIFLLCMLLFFNVSVEAADISLSNPTITILDIIPGDANKDGGSISDMCNDVNVKIHDKKLLVDKFMYDDKRLGQINDKLGGDYVTKDDYATPFLTYNYISGGNSSEDYCNVVVNMSEYNKLDDADKQTVMQITLETISASNITESNKNEIYDKICKLDELTSSYCKALNSYTNDDFMNAYKWFLPFSSPIGILFGLIALVLFVLLAFTSVIDMSYIAMPIIRELLGRLSSYEKPKFVSLEAARAVMEQESKAGVEKVNPLVVYFKSKFRQYVAIAFCLLYLTSGKIFTLLSNCINYFSSLKA